jgi:hypothetical protein
MLNDIFTRVPINGTAQRVVGQKNATPDSDIGRDDLVKIIDLLGRKHRLLKRVLGISNRTQHRNLMYRFSKRHHRVDGHKNPRALTEYVFVGAEIQRFMRLLEEKRRESSPALEIRQPSVVVLPTNEHKPLALSKEPNTP